MSELLFRKPNLGLCLAATLIVFSIGTPGTNIKTSGSQLIKDNSSQRYVDVEQINPGNVRSPKREFAKPG